MEKDRNKTGIPNALLHKIQADAIDDYLRFRYAIPGPLRSGQQSEETGIHVPEKPLCGFETAVDNYLYLRYLETVDARRAFEQENHDDLPF